jgi:hypothetical protein
MLPRSTTSGPAFMVPYFYKPRIAYMTRNLNVEGQLSWFDPQHNKDLLTMMTSFKSSRPCLCDSCILNCPGALFLMLCYDLPRACFHDTMLQLGKGLLRRF